MEQAIKHRVTCSAVAGEAMSAYWKLNKRLTDHNSDCRGNIHLGQFLADGSLGTVRTL
ncbi:hypothetical protein J4727_17935 [Providencia rettgeri]|uniref:Uncharacterized protein n=1 Tax=Providencia rettgeri TaxID=587 RepID=A0A939SPJ4_PRORE|nr:hypothetical protein [Providencia rettgeri]